MKKALKRLFIGTAAVGIFATSTVTTFAAAGWQVIGYHTLPIENDSGVWPDATLYQSPSYTLADGGNVGIKIANHSAYWDTKGYSEGAAPRLDIIVYEDDGWAGDDYVTTIHYDPRDGEKTFTVPMNGRGDGDGNMIEVELRYKWNYDSTVDPLVTVLD